MASLLVTVITFALSNFVIKILVALGVGFFSYAAISTLLDAALVYVTQYMHQLPSSVIQLLALAGVDTGLSIMGSALVVSASFRAAKVFVGKMS